MGSHRLPKAFKISFLAPCCRHFGSLRPPVGFPFGSLWVPSGRRLWAKLIYLSTPFSTGGYGLTTDFFLLQPRLQGHVRTLPKAHGYIYSYVGPRRHFLLFRTVCTNRTKTNSIHTSRTLFPPQHPTGTRAATKTRRVTVCGPPNI